jgi:hypothetical protein
MDRNAFANTICHFISIEDPNFVFDAFTLVYTDTNGKRHTICYSKRDGNWDVNLDPNPNVHEYPVTHGNLDANPESHTHGDKHADPHIDVHPYDYPHIDCYSDLDSNVHDHADSRNDTPA